MTADRPEIVVAGWSVLAGTLFAVLVALQALALCLLWWSWHWGAVAAAGVLTGYAGMAALGYGAGRRFHAWLARQGGGARPPLRRPGLVTVASIGILCGMSSGDDLRWMLVMGVVLPLAALPTAGLFAGFCLAAVAFGRGTDFRGALGAVRRLHREARRAEWNAAIAGVSFGEAR